MESRRKILLVDDDDDIRSVLAEFLENLGFEILALSSAREGLRAFASAHHGEERRGGPSSVFNLVISDIQMPERGGIDFLRDLRHVDPDISVLLMSAFVSKRVTYEALLAGANAVIAKPFQLTDFIDCLHAVMGEKQRESESPDDAYSDFPTQQYRQGRGFRHS